MKDNKEQNNKVQGLLEKGNIDLNNRPRVKNPDGSISTVLSMSANFDGKEYLIPMVSDEGKILTEEQAIDYFKKTKKHLGVFDSPDSATKYAQQLHREQEKQYVGTEQDFTSMQNEQIDKAIGFINSKFQPTFNISYPASSPQDADTNISITQPFQPTSIYDEDRVGVGLPPALWPREGIKPLGFFEAVGREAFSMTMPGDIYEAYAKRQAFAPVDNPNMQNSLSAPIPDNWMPTDNKQLLQSVPAKYRDSLITGVTSPQQQQNIYNYIKEQIAKEEQWNNQPYLQKWVAGLGGGAIGIGIDAFMFKWLAPFKYIGESYNFLQRTGLEAGNILAYSFTREGVTTAVDPEKKYEDVGYNALRDTAIGLAFYGGFEGLSFVGQKLKLGEKISSATSFTSDAMDKAKEAFNYNIAGIEPRFNVNGKGEIESLTAGPTATYAESAQKLDNAKIFYGSQMAKKGLFWFPQTYTSPFNRAINLLSNTVKGLTTEGPVSAITNAIVHHNLETIDGKKYIPNNQSFQAELDAIDGKIKLYQSQFEGYRKHYNGQDLTETEEEQLKKFNSKLDKNDILDPAHFGNRVVNNVISFGADTNPTIRDATKLWKDSTTPHYQRFLRSQNLNDKIFPQRVYEDYISRSFNRIQMRNNRQTFINSTVKAFKDQDALILQYMTPINQLVEQRNLASEKIFKNEDVIQNQNLYESLTTQISKKRQELYKAQLDDPNLKIVLDGYTTLSSSDVKGLKKLLKPYNEILSQIQDVNKQLTEKNNKLFLLEREIKKQPKKDADQEAHLKKIKKMNEERNALLAEIEEIESIKKPLQANADDEMSRLRKSVLTETESGETVPREWYFYNEEGKITFKDPDEVPKFRDLFRDEEEMEEEASRYYDSIMGYTDEDLSIVSLNNFTNPQSTKGRKLFVNSSYYLENNFLNTNLPEMIESYVRPLAKNYLLNEKLENFAGVTKKGIDGYTQLLSNYYNDKRATAERLPQKKKEKALAKLAKQEKLQKEFVTNLINGYVGIRPDKMNEAVYELGRMGKLLAVATRLGNTALAQYADLAGIIHKNGVFNFLQAGLSSSVASLNGLIKSKQGVRLKRYAQELGLGLEHMGRSQFRKAYEGEFNTSGPQNIIVNALEATAHFSQRIALVHFMENMNQRMAASTAQHTFMKLLTKFSTGKKLSNSDRLMLETYGLKPEDWAESVMEQFKTYGEKTFFGYQSDFYKWTDAKTQSRFSNAVFNATKDAIIQGKNVDLPFIRVPVLNKYINLQNPMHQNFMQFMSYAFAAFNKYTVPFMQQLQAKQMLAITMMSAAGIQYYINRKYSRGEEADINSEEFFKEAFANSGATSLIYKGAQWVNAFAGADIEFLKNDKARNTSRLGMASGPTAGIYEAIGNFIGMAIQGAWNKEDTQKFLRATLPFNNFWMYQGTQKMYDTLTDGLPKNRKQAKMLKD